MNDLILLAMLQDGPKHGYQLKREAGFILGHGDMHNNLVYPLLRRFTEKRWVVKKQMPGKRGQTRQQYALTGAGQKELQRRLTEYTEQDAKSAEGFIARAGMFSLVAPQARREILEQRKSYLEARQSRLAQIEVHVAVGDYGKSVMEFMHDCIRLELSWIGKLRRMQK